MKNRMNVSALMALAAIGSIALGTSAYGQEDRFRTIPTSCIIIADEVVVNDQTFTSAGVMNLTPGAVSPPDEEIDWMQLQNAGFSARSEDEALGIITWDLDNSRPVETSMLRSNQADALFPATVQLDFNVRATISSLPGRVFLSRTPISIRNENVMDWPPGDLQINSVDGAVVEFFEEDNPDQTAFILNRVNSTVRD